MQSLNFDFRKFLSETRMCLLDPRNYYASMPKEGGFTDPVLKALAYGFLASVFSFIWKSFNMLPYSGILTAGNVLTNLMLSLLGGVLLLFIIALVVQGLSMVTGGSRAFEPSLRGAASMLALYTLGSALDFTEGIHPALGTLVSAAIWLYGMWMLYNLLGKALGTKEEPTKIAVILLAVIPSILMMSSLVAKYLIR